MVSLLRSVQYLIVVQQHCCRVLALISILLYQALAGPRQEVALEDVSIQMPFVVADQFTIQCFRFTSQLGSQQAVHMAVHVVILRMYPAQP